MSGDADRLVRVEERLGALAKSDERKEKALERMEEAISRLANAVSEMASIRIDHERHENEISNVRQRVHSLTNEVARYQILENEIEYVRRDVSENRADIKHIKLAIPNMELASGWVFKAILGVMGLLGTSVFGMLVWLAAHGAFVAMH